MNAKATRCESNGCIEAEGIDGIVLLRSTVTHGAMPCTREEFAVFVKRVRDGEFDGIGSEPMPSESSVKQIHRYEVPIDDQAHEFSLTGNILHVAQRSDHAVEFWAFDIEGNPVEEVRLQVFGTGMEIPVASVYRGTAFSPAGGFDPFPIPAGKYVWHLIQLLAE